MTQKERRINRDKKLRLFFTKLQKDNPKWRYDALLEDTADHFNLATDTVTDIINKRGIYADNAILNEA